MTKEPLKLLIGAAVLITHTDGEDYPGVVQAVSGAMAMVRFDRRRPIIGRSGASQFAAWLWYPTADVRLAPAEYAAEYAAE